MADNTATYEIKVTSSGLKITVKDINSLGDATKRATKNTKEARGASEDLYNTQNKGVIGTANSTKSFSKLAQTIGSGQNGLVGVYATLAANAFAVAASFNALRTGAQVVQVLEGLELQGARTGKALALTAKNIESITQGALSGAEAMKAAALGSSAGLARKDIEDLTKVATNASLVLGRNIPDSMDRIIKGVTKLEPELLDELGLMTKLTEASENYARATGKSATSLTNFEKRRAFVEAIKTEGNLKYDGVSEDLGVNKLDQLGAAFDNLKNKIFASIEASSVVSGAISVMTDSSTGLLSALVLLGSYVARQYTMHLRGMAAQSMIVANALKSKAIQMKADTKATVGATKAALEKAKADSVVAAGLGKKLTGKAQNTMTSALGGDQKALDQAIKSREESNKRYEKQIKDLAGKEDDASKKKLNNAKEQVAANALKIESLNALKTAESSYNSSLQRDQVRSVRTQAALQGSLAQGRAALAMEAAGAFKLGQSYRNVTASISNYSEQLKLNTQANNMVAAASGRSLGILSASLPIIGSIAPAVNAARVGFFALGLSIKTVGIAFATALPWIGVVMAAFSIAQTIYQNVFKTEDTKKKQKALEDLSTVITTVTKSISELDKVQSANNLTVGGKALKALTIQTNAMVELTDAYLEATKFFSTTTVKTADSVKLPLGSASLAFDAYRKSAELALYLAPSAARNNTLLKKELGLTTDIAGEAARKMISGFDQFTDYFGGNGVSDEENIILKTLDSIAVFDPAMAKTIKTSDNFEETQNNIRKALIAGQPVWQKAQAAVQNFSDAVKTAETAQVDFIKSISATTKFDNAIDSFTALNNSIKDLKESLSGGEFDGTNVEKLLNSLGPSTRGILSVSDQLGLDEVASKYKDINRLNIEYKRLQQEGNENSKTAKDILAAREGLEQSIAGKIRALEPTIISATKQYEEQLRIDRIRSITIQSIVSLEQARLEKIQRAGVIVASDLKKQIDSQNKLKVLQMEQITIETKYLELQASKEEAKLRELESTYRLIEAGNIQLTQAEELVKNSLLLQKSSLDTELGADPLMSAASPDKFRQLSELRDAVNKDLDKLTNPEEVKKRYTELLDSQKKSLELARAQIKASRAQAAAIGMGIIGQAEKNLTAQELTIKNAADVQKASEAVLRANSENSRVTKETSDRISGRYNDLVAEANLIREQAKERRTDLLLQTAASIAELSRQRDLAKLNKNSDQIKELSTRIALAEQEYEASSRLEESKARLAIIQKVLTISIEDSIKQQQDALSILQKQADLSKTILDSQLDIERANARIAAKRFGADIDPVTEQVLAKKAAEAEYQAALNSHQLRLLGIDAEYDLLEAQRLTQVGSIRASIMLTEAVLTASANGMTEVQKKTLDASKSAANILESSSYNIAREQAKDVERLGLEKLRLAKEEASIINLGEGSALMGAIANLGVIFSGIPDVAKAPEAKYVSPEIKSIAETNNQQLESLKTLADAILTGSFSHIPESLNTIVGILRKSEDSSKAVRTGSIKANAADMAKYTKDAYAGAKVTEIAGFGRTKNPTGGHSNNSKHYTGEAFDVNMIGGIDANDPKSKAILDKMAVDLSTKGMKVLWNGFVYEAGRAVAKIQGNKHRDHLHAETSKLVSRVIKNSEEAVTTGAKEATDATNISKLASDPEIVVSATKGLVANDNEKMDMGDIIDINITKTGELNKVLAATSPTVQQLGLALASVFSAYNTDLDKLSANLGEVGQAQVEVLKAGLQLIANLSVSIPQTMGLLNTSYDEYKTKMLDVNNTLVASGKEQAKIMTQGQYQAQQLAAGFSAAAAAIGGVISLLQATSNAKMASIDKEISAEEKRDGKSSQSVAKLEALEKKKDTMARKAFNTNKKLMMAQAVMSTAAGVANALASGPAPWNIIMAGIVGAMGAAQLAIISGTSYESSSAPKSASVPSSISIGKRSDTVDLAKGPNANAGGESGYLRGAQGTGSNASNYHTVGSAYGGKDMMRGYGNRGFVVGEKGPEVITPETPITVTPANDVGNSQSMNATINIQALDSTGVQDILVSQKGNIIKMLRDAANATGKSFMEEVNTNVYTRPNISKL